ncbi:MAG: SpoIIIAC/SpoIIIAD family protein [Lachnospiraceae bacterium]
MVKLAVIAILATILCIKFAMIQREYSLYLSLATCLLILFFIMNQLSEVVAGLKQFAAAISVGKDYITLLLKLIGIAYVCEFAAALCRDSGQTAIAGQLEMAGKFSILLVSMPVVAELFNMIGEFFHIA